MNEIIPKNIRILVFFRPEYFKVSISLLSKSFMKNNCAVIKKINGNISNIIEGEFKSDKNRGK
tara:strand:- start:204 stop:392 length:189 start_codon:yes stop_codon:yes gene_type:complete